MIDKSELMRQLRAAIDAAGSQQAFADAHDISEAYLSDVLRGRREPGQRVLAALGVERIVFYQPKRDEATQ